MNKNRTIFYVVFAIFHVSAFIFTLQLHDLGFLMKIAEYISWFKFITFFGIVLVTVDFVWSWIVMRESRKENAALTHELNTLKAKLFDMQEKARELETLKNTPKAK